jgi:hypothetical protein
VSTYWPHSDPEPARFDEVPQIDPEAAVDDEPAIPAVGSGLCPVPHRGGRCEYDDGNPRRVMVGMLICSRHRYGAEKQLAGLVDIWELLGDPTRTKARSLGGRTKGEPPAPNSEAVAARNNIEALLLRVERVIRDTNQTPVTNPDTVRAQTRRLMVDTSTSIRDTLDTVKTLDGIPKTEGRWARADNDRLRARARVADLRTRLAGLEHDSNTGRDVVAARSERCQRHLDHLAMNGDRIVEVVRDIEAVWRDANKTAYPLPEGVRVACPKCGTRVRLRHGGDFEDIWCPGEIEGPDGMEPCGEHANAMGWAQLLGVSASALTEDEAVVWLREHHRMKIAGATIRDWVRRGKLTGSTEVRDGKHRTVYHPVQLLDAATTYKPRTGAAS